jgi:hypothetical protein
MHRRTRSQLSNLGLAAALIAGCVPGPGGVGPTTRRATPAPAVASTAPPRIAAVPTPAVGGGIIANNAANLTGKVKVPAGIVSDHGGAIISDQGGNIIGNNGGSILGNNGASRRLLATQAQLPYVGATVRLLDAAGQPVPGPDGRPLTATTDAQGAYSFRATLPARNLLVDVQLPEGKGSVQAIAPRATTSVDVDLISTLTTGYILEEYVKTQQDPLATLEKLPADVERETRSKAAAAVDAASFKATALHPADVVKAVDGLRKADASFDAQMETVKKLLIVAGASDLGTGLKALDVTIGQIDDLRFAQDGTAYLLNTQDNRVWKLRKDGTLEVAAGDRRPPDATDLAGKLPTEANLSHPDRIALDPQDHLVIVDARGTYRVGDDGKLARLTDLHAVEVAAGTNGDLVIATLEDPPDGLPAAFAGAPRMYVFYRLKPGAAPERLFTQLQDPNDDGETTVRLAGLAWDGGNTFYAGVDTGGRSELWRYDFTARAKTVETPSAGKLYFDGRHVTYTDAAGAFHAKPLFGAGPVVDVPTPQQWSSLLALGPDNLPYAVKFGSLYRLDATGPVRVAGVESGNAGAGGSATVFTFEVLSDSTVDPQGNVYALDTGKGGIFKVDANHQITKFAEPGAGNVQMLHADRQGTLYMSDGDGAKIGRFDAKGTWSALYSVPALITGFDMLADGTGYASNWDTTDRKLRIFRLANGTATPIDEADTRQLIALDPQGTLWAAGGGKLRKWDGTAWSTVKADDRFTFKRLLGTGGGMAIDGKGRLYFADPDTPNLFRYDPAKDQFANVAGPGTARFGGSGTDNSLNQPRTPSFDAAGNLYFSDTGNRQVKRIAGSELEN